MTLGLGAVPAVIILLMRHDLPETAVWLVRNGRFREAKQVAMRLYSDPLKMLPDEDVVVPKPNAAGFLTDLRKDPIRWRATLYGYIACFLSGQRVLHLRVLPAGAVPDGRRGVRAGHRSRDHGALHRRRHCRLGGTADHPAIGQRGIAIAGFAIVLVSLLVAAWALYTDHVAVLPFAAAAMLWGHYWDASNCMTIPTVVAKPEYRGTASGFAYMFVKLPSFLSIFLFPTLFAAVGQATATLMVAIFPLIGLLSAIFILPEIYGYEHD